ncbi:arylesterase [Albimonas sp. CAU 1670]|uniref:arylesterase n=1 Tax=Albimonas sp. CAU 1670 TaxID=3032599 RepID=UPI0023D981C2|nr:arylesterase [Albimonas sp. CAU 1670]MDF2234950.1 arylesterase [Albimonas sp. CAU 1670]
MRLAPLLRRVMNSGPCAYGARGRRLKAAAASVFLTLATAGSVAAAETTLLALGDSLTHGYGLAQEEGFVPQLEAWLRARGHDVDVINAGVSGDTTRGGLSRLDWSLTPEVDAVIVELGGNDLLRGIDPASSKANLDAILAALDEKGLPALLAGLPAPRNYGEDWRQAFDGMYPELAETHGALLYPNFLAGIGGLDDREAARGLMQADGIHPNAEGVKKVVEDIGPMVEELIARAKTQD